MFPAIAPSLLVILLTLPTPALAQTPTKYQELKTWCVLRAKEGPREETPASAAFDARHAGMQPYCNAMMAWGRSALTTDKQETQTMMGVVISESTSAIANLDSNHPLLAEVYTLRGKAREMMGKYGEAEADLRLATQLDQKHGDAHAALVRLYLETKRKDKGLAALKAGLAAAPEHKVLARLAQQYKVAIPKPAARPEPAATPVSPPAATTEQPSTTAPPAKEAIGSSANPWCRFCPDRPAEEVKQEAKP